MAEFPQTNDPEAHARDLREECIRRMITYRALFKAAQRGFRPGVQNKDWLEAEREIRDGIPPQ